MLHAQEKTAAFETIQRIGKGLTNIAKIFTTRRWDNKLQELQNRATVGDETAQHMMSMLGMLSVAAGAAGGLGTARLLGAGRGGLALGTAAGSALGTLPLAVAGDRKPSMMLPGFDMDKALKAGRIETGSRPMKKEADGLLKLDAKGVSLPALRALYSRDIAGALQHPGIVALVARRKERVRRLTEELNNPGSHLKTQEEATGPTAGEQMMPMTSLPMAPGAPIPPSNHLGLLGGGGGGVGMPAGGMPGKISARLDAFFKKDSAPVAADTSTGKRAEAFKYGFFTKIAECGLMPSEFHTLIEKRAGLAIPFFAGQTAGRAVGKVGEEAGGLAKWLAGTAGKTGLFLGKLPLWLALLGGTGAGISYRMLTAPGYADPEELQHIEQTSLYKRLGREASMRARRMQIKRLAQAGTKEKGVKVPRIEAAA
ncbi:hypothetical protein LCGC14_0917690 [marine sediment metagenome]|uniref:Uncharacterized protein n=1 Tax=marine sediment metagenome TaxID=412755 RepID=A0A0F9NRT6_9ZZZZ